MFHRDILFLARVVNGSMNVERGRHDLVKLSPALQPVAERLLLAPPQGRQSIWDDLLAGRLRSDAMTACGPDSYQSPEPARDAEVPTSPDPQQPPPALDHAITPGTKRRVRLTCAIDVGTSQVDWLWAGRVPRGMITMFAGDPKLGKSFVTIDLAAALSHGRPLPSSDEPHRPGSTILMSAEDDPARTIVPRLKAAGADLAKIHILESVILANGSEMLPSLLADIDAITAAATGLGDCRLIVIDPVSAYLKGVDDNRNADLRGVLAPLKALAERLRAAVVLVSHLTKGGSGNGKHRVLGSIAYIGSCRANFLFVADPDDPTGQRVLLLDNGGNLAPQAPPLAFVIDDHGDGPRIAWSDEPTPISVAQALKSVSAAIQHGEQGDERVECENWLRGFLTDGSKATIDVFKVGNAAGFTRDQVRRAKCRIGVRARRDGYGANGQWNWRLNTGTDRE